MSDYSKGFSLIECLIYCAISSCLSMMLFAFFSRTMNGVHFFSSHQQEIVSHWSVQQLLRKDIQMASKHPTHWHASATSLICKVGAECIGWKLQNENLYRIKGNYNFLEHQWHKKSAALVASKVKHFDISLQQNHDLIESIEYQLRLGAKIAHKKIVLFESMG